jgi:cell fate (sporulation/competence/biofilm development) regulator YlbF (YheA/YmcA/DUF963 family)
LARPTSRKSIASIPEKNAPPGLSADLGRPKPGAIQFLNSGGLVASPSRPAKVFIETRAVRVYQFHANQRGQTSRAENLFMQTTLESDVIVAKTRELCETILLQPEYREIREKIDAFMADEEARAQYETVTEKGEALHHKQHSGVELSPAEVADFEHHRDALVNNQVARGFMDARQRIHKIQETVNQHVTKTFELGRLPEESDFEEGGCGHSCGCSH